MLCEKCEKNPATVHAKDLVNGRKTGRRLCESCYDAAGLDAPLPAVDLEAAATPKIDLALGLASIEMSAPAPSDALRRCPKCGLSLAEFQRRKAIGCPHDYEVFADEIEDVLVKLHGARVHHGKVPKSIEAERAREQQISNLNADLERAVESEAYETAAKLRDRIRALEAGRTVEP